MNCLRPIFEIYDKDAKLEDENGVLLRFKRVDNYREMNVQEIFIHEMYNKTGDLFQVKELLKEQFQIAEEEAVEKIAVYANNEFKGEDIEDSPGFPVHMEIKNSNEAVFKVEISKHNEYIDILNTYIEGLLYITQTKIGKEITDMCLKSKKREPVVEVPQIQNRIVVQPQVLQIQKSLLEEELGIAYKDVSEMDKEDIDLQEEESPNIEDFDFEEEMEGGSNNNESIEIDEFPKNEDFEAIHGGFNGHHGLDYSYMSRSCSRKLLQSRVYKNRDSK